MANLSKEGAYTPGPWRTELNPSNSKQWIVIASTHETVVHSVAGGRDHAKANARLIAAAPELLAALKAIFEDNCFYHKDGDERAYRMATEAIAKAEGAS